MDLVDKIIILVTTDSEEEAGEIANLLVNQRKAACVNIIPSIKSIFWWQKKIDSAKEAMLVAKTKNALLKRLISAVKRLHTYDVPEIIALPIVGVNKDYLRWLNESTS